MPHRSYAGPLPSTEAIKQAVRLPLADAPREIDAFAVFILLRARAIEGRLETVKPGRTESPCWFLRPSTHTSHRD